ncbi:hypothetical protein EV687_2178, partial [Corticibacter populi]
MTVLLLRCQLVLAEFLGNPAYQQSETPHRDDLRGVFNRSLTMTYFHTG